MKPPPVTATLAILAAAAGAVIVAAQERGAPPSPAAEKRAPSAPSAFPAETIARKEAGKQLDFPDACADGDGRLWVAYIEHDGVADTLRLAEKSGSKLEPVGAVAGPGIIHQPALAADGNGAIWCLWGQTGDDDVVHLHARPFRDGEFGETLTVARSGGADTFADAGTDPAGRVWVVWQSMRAGEGDIYAKRFDPGEGTWSDEIAVATAAGGDWEPRVAFDGSGGAWVAFDSSRGNEFNLYLARLREGGGVDLHEIGHSPRYEARAEIVADAGGEGFWIAGERGRVRWGLDVRGHGAQKGINAQKEIAFGHFRIADGSFTEHPPVTARKLGAPVNLPALGLDGDGNPWLAYRYFKGALWQIGVARFDRASGRWSDPRTLFESPFGQDRRAVFANDGAGRLWLAWPSDGRTSKKCLESGVFLGRIDTSVGPPPGEPSKGLGDLTAEPFAASQGTPERPPHDRHHWEFGGRRYGLYWGDVHRHTDVSNCRTGTDGCINEQFRYAYDLAKLDFLGTSDHTDVGKKYDPYEWWHNGRMADVFQAPGQFVSLYVYEREQRHPWGHRNVVFAQRGGPVVYIRRDLYRNSPWQELYPAKAGLREIDPPELWQILRAYGEPVALVSHTGATGMGTDWGRYDEIDSGLENSVEIYQGARVSYEGAGAPQPTAGLRPGEGYTIATGREPAPAPPAAIPGFGDKDTGVYQNALARGHKLGVFASSDHISQHVSYGGVYVENFTREEIIGAFRARRTIAATDKIYLDFSCSGHAMGSVFETAEAPALDVRVDGTAPLRRVTVVRNERDHKVYDGVGGKVLEVRYVDADPPAGEARYYIRVEQEDGNMAWSSPVWVTRN